MSTLKHSRSNNLIDNMFNDLFNENMLVQPYMNDIKRRSPAVASRDEDWQIVFAIPGVKKDQVNIKVDDHVLTVSYDNKQKDDYFSFVSSFNRSWELDRGVDISKIVANHEDGILKITVPKPEAKKRVVRTIEVSQMTRFHRGGVNRPSPKDIYMQDEHYWKIGDLVKILEDGKLGIVIKLHTKAGTPFYLVHENLTNKQVWYPEYSIDNPTTVFAE